MSNSHRTNSQSSLPHYSKLRYIPFRNEPNRCKYVDRSASAHHSSGKARTVPHKNICDSISTSTLDPAFIFVWDLDETLVFFDEHGEIFKGEPMYYLHPQARVWLKFCNRVPNAMTLLWSHGHSDYVHDAVFRLELNTYFDVIYTHKECEKSLEEFGALKAYEFIQHKIPTSLKTQSILIDDRALINSKFNSLPGENTYTHIIQPPPFTAQFITNFMNNKIDKYYNFTLNNLHNFYIMSLDISK